MGFGLSPSARPADFAGRANRWIGPRLDAHRLRRAVSVVAVDTRTRPHYSCTCTHNGAAGLDHGTVSAVDRRINFSTICVGMLLHLVAERSQQARSQQAQLMYAVHNPPAAASLADVIVVRRGSRCLRGISAANDEPILPDAQRRWIGAGSGRGGTRIRTSGWFLIPRRLPPDLDNSACAGDRVSEG